MTTTNNIPKFKNPDIYENNAQNHPAKTLTDEEIIDIACKSAIGTTQIETDFGNASIEFARAILKKASEK